MYGKMKEHLSNTLAEIKEAGLYKEERLIESAQQAAITVKGKEVLNFCANNYLGLSNHPRLIAAAQKMMDHRGYGMSSADETYGRHAVATVIHHLLGSGNQSRMVGQTQVIVGAEIQHFLPFYGDGGLLRTLDQALFFVESGLFNFSKRIAEVFFHFPVHSFIN